MVRLRQLESALYLYCTLCSHSCCRVLRSPVPSVAHGCTRRVICWYAIYHHSSRLMVAAC